MIRHKTAKGHEFNMAAFSQMHEHVTAVGNVRRNAAGDILNASGEITATVKELQTSYYNRSPNAVKTVSIKEDGTIPPVLSENVKSVTKDVAEKQRAVAAKQSTLTIDDEREFTDETGAMKLEITYSDGSIEVRDL
jgi:hypothetical protein